MKSNLTLLVQADHYWEPVPKSRVPNIAEYTNYIILLCSKVNISDSLSKTTINVDVKGSPHKFAVIKNVLFSILPPLSTTQKHGVWHQETWRSQIVFAFSTHVICSRTGGATFGFIIFIFAKRGGGWTNYLYAQCSAQVFKRAVCHLISEAPWPSHLVRWTDRTVKRAQLPQWTEEKGHN